MRLRAGLLCLLLAAGTARAQPAPPAPAPETAATEAARARARAIAREAAEAYEQGDYAAALARFEEAYRTFPSPRLFFNIGQAQRQLARPVLATEAFERFLLEATDAPAEAVAEARRSLAELAGQVSRIEIASDVAGAEVLVDGRSYGYTPLAQPVLVTPGPHQVVVQRPGGATFLQRIEAVAGSTLRITASLGTAGAPPAPAPVPAAPAVIADAAPPPPAAGPSGARVVGLALLAAAPVLGGVGLYFGTLARDEARDIALKCAVSCPGSEIVDKDRARRQYGAAQWLLLGGGAAALGAGAVLALWGGAQPATAPVTVAVGPAGAAAAFHGRW